MPPGLPYSFTLFASFYRYSSFQLLLSLYLTFALWLGQETLLFFLQLSKWTDQNMHNKGNKCYRNNSLKNSKYTKGEKQVCTQYLLLCEEKKITWVSQRKFLVTTRTSQNPILRIKLPFLEVIRTAEETFFFLRQKQYCGVKWSIKKQNS